MCVIMFRILLLLYFSIYVALIKEADKCLCSLYFFVDGRGYSRDLTRKHEVDWKPSSHAGDEYEFNGLKWVQRSDLLTLSWVPVARKKMFYATLSVAETRMLYGELNASRVKYVRIHAFWSESSQSTVGPQEFKVYTVCHLSNSF